MSEEESIDISARDLMAGWLDDLDNPQKIQKKYADHEGGDQKRGRGRGGQGGGGGGQRNGGGGGGRGRPSGGGGRPPGGGGDRGRGRDGQRSSGGGRGPRQGGRDGGRGRGRGRRDEERRPPAPALIEGLDVKLLPEKSALESIATFVRKTGRAYPMWDIAQTMLGSRERYRIGFRKSKDAGVMAPDLLRCSLDDSLWLTREEGLEHVVRSGLLSHYYRTEKVEVEPPKGNFTVIAVHRKSGEVLGPPNHHEYRRNLTKLHQKRFRHIPFDRFSKEVDMRRDEETIEAWKESVSVVKHWVHVGLEGSIASEGSGSEEAVSDQPPGGEGEAIVEEGVPAVEDAPATEEVPVVEEGAVAEEAPVEETAVEETAVEEVSSEGEAPAAEEASSEGEAPAGEEESDASAEGESSEEEAAPAEEVAPIEETPAVAEELVLKSEEEVAKHFDETYGEVVFFPTDKFFVPGDIKGSKLSSGLLALLRSEVEGRRKAPMTLIQDLCRGLEKHGVKFFKEGKKMFVTAARPRALEATVEIGDSPKRLLEFVKEHQGTTVMRMMEGLVPGFEAPKKGEKVPEHKPSAEEMQFVSDMRWLTSEGYLVEYSSGRVRLGSEAGKTAGRNEPREGQKKKRTRKRQPRPRSGSQKGGAERSDVAEPASETSGIKKKEVSGEDKSPKAEEETGKSPVEEAVVEAPAPEGAAPVATDDAVAPKEVAVDSPVEEGAVEEKAPEGEGTKE